MGLTLGYSVEIEPLFIKMVVAHHAIFRMMMVGIE